jgi:aryl-alcohol dehydrogenase-like predicted oxidoreductase
MRYLRLGNSGLRVSEICLGTMSFGDNWGFGANAGESRRVFDAYQEAGGNFIDTANKYHEGHTEEIVADLVAGQRDRLVLATKYTLSMFPNDPNAGGNSRKNLVTSVNDSLKRLRTDYIDLLWVHAWDTGTPIEETMRALDDVVRAGKVLYVGISDTPAWVVSRGQTLAELRGWSPFVGIQVRWSLLDREVERELVPMAKDLGLGVCAWGPMAAGLLTGKYTRGDGGVPDDSKRAKHQMGRLNDKNTLVAKAVDEVADELGVTSAQVAVAWVSGAGTGVVPIIGARKLSQINDTLGATSVVLTSEQRARLDEVSAIKMGFPHDFLQNESIRKTMFGNHHERIER